MKNSRFVKFLKKSKLVLLFLLFSTLSAFLLIEDFGDKVSYKIHRLLISNKISPRPLEIINEQFKSVFPSSNGRKIYDCCIFFNELEVLLIRLNELYNYVDYFVIVESEETHRGDPKPLNFVANRHLFDKFLDKIIYVPIERIRGSQSAYSWKRENYQRNQIMSGLKNTKDEDIIMISDLDEIPKGAHLPQLVHRLLNSADPIIYCGHKTYRYFLNRWDIATTPWPGTAITTFKFLKHHSPQYIRRRKDRSLFPLVSSGWHFTCMGGYQGVIKKYESVVLHKGDSEEILKSIDRIRREASQQFLVKIDDSFPDFVQKNRNFLTSQNLIDSSTDICFDQLCFDYVNLRGKSCPTWQELCEPYRSAKILPYDPTGWFNISTFDFLKNFIKQHRVETIIEIAPWLGLSTQCLARLLPDTGTVYAIDTWSSEDLLPKDPRGQLAYEYFLSNMIHAQITHKIIPIRKDPIEALRQLDLHPQLIFIGAFRSHENVHQDILECASKIDSNGLICGIHGKDEMVLNAVSRAATDLNLSMGIEDTFWYLQKQK